MPDSYSNPSFVPPTRPYTWVPDVTPTGGEAPIGFSATRIERGSFRNDVPIQEGFSGGTLTVTTTGELISDAGSENNPILAVHRPRSDPSNDRGTPPSVNFAIKGADFKWQAEFVRASRISSITIEYALVVDIQDPALLNLLEEPDKAVLISYLANPSSEPLSIDWSKYYFAKITLDDVEYPALDANSKPKQLAVTGITNTTKNINVKFVESFVVSGFPSIKKLAISNRIQLSTLQLVLSKVYIFEADRVNLHDEQLPCALLEYAYPVSFSFTPNANQNAQRLPFPSDSANPNFHIKVFSPEEKIANKFGFAHSVNLRFLIFSMQILGIDPTGVNSLYFVVFIGPTPGKKTVRMALSGALATNQIVNSNNNRVLAIDTFLIEKDTQSIVVEKIDSASLSSQPSDNANWQRIANSTYTVSGGNVFDSSGPYVSEYLYLDQSISEFNWYRIAQSLRSGGLKYSAPFKNLTYSERNVYKALLSASTSTKKDTITRRTVLISDKNPLEIDMPIATFVTEGFDAFTAFNQFRKGSFKLAIRAKVDDTNYLLNTHIFARFWFIPYDSDIDVDNLYQYRNDKTEFYFETTSTGTKLVAGTPKSMQQVIISPPVPNTLTYLEMARYNDAVVNKPTGNHKIAVALYAVSYPSADGELQGVNKDTINLPKITVELDTQYSYFETTLEQTSSNVLFAQKSEKYDSSQFINVDKPLIVSVNKIGGGTLDNQNFSKYDSKFKSNDANPFTGLLSLEKSTNGASAKFTIPVTSISEKIDEKNLIFADFATNGNALDSGRVLDGIWNVEFEIDRGVDTNVLAIDCRLEMFLVNNDGKVTERIFRSSIIKGVSSSGDSTLKYTTEIKLPMIIGGSGTQLVARLIGYPYSRNGEAVDVASLQSQLGDKPLGLRVESFEIVEHTLSRLSISQASSFLGSPAFYEDLPLTPTQSIGQTSDFWFIVSDFLTNTIVVDANTGVDISGCLYAPAWFVNMPKGMEVYARGQGFKDNDVWFRTVVADGVAGESSVSAVEDKMTKTIHVAHESQDEVSQQSVVSAMATSSVIKHKIFDSPYSTSILNQNIAGNDGGEIKNLSNKHPNLQLMNMGGFDNTNQAVLGLISQLEGNDYASAQTNMNTSLNTYGSWFGANRDLSGADFSAIKKFADGFSSLSMTQSPTSSLTYVAGWSNPGAILLKEANIWDSNDSGAPGIIYLIDGEHESNADSSPIIQPTFVSGLKAVQTFPGVLVDSQNRIVVAYTLEGRAGELFARNIIAGQLSNPYVIATFRSSGLSSSDVEIFAPTMYYHEATQSNYVAMWCSGKIFITTFNSLKTSNGILLNPLQLVAGNKNFSTGNNPANSIFQSLVQSGDLTNNVLGTEENDVPRQRVGLVVSDKWPFQGNAFVYYRDNNEKLMVRQVRIGGVSGAPLEVQ